MSSPSPTAVRNSALWAAWGDALGFITELVDAEGVTRRSGAPTVQTTIPWRRRVGGQFGPTVDLAAGVYSDDTQLRLAVARAIRSDGTFDVEAFAKVELPVWLAYALGAGLGTRAAASNLARRDVAWSSNFYEDRRVRYLDSGGNGAAMRIQPHVWAAADHDPATFIPSVIVDSITTHGHPRGFVGAAFHALTLGHALRRGSVPGPADWPTILDQLETLPAIVSSNEMLELWLPLWEQRSDTDLATAVRTVVDECREHIAAFGQYADSPRAYQELAWALDAFHPSTRGSGTRTAVLAAVGAWIFRKTPLEGVTHVANTLGSDTDTIATMMGALLGATTAEPPPGAVADAEYIASGAERLWQIGSGAEADDHVYPDLLRWKPPRSQVDAIGRIDGGLAVAGLGPVKPLSEEQPMRGKDESVWQWMEIWFGQAILAKRRREPTMLSPGSQVPASRRRGPAPSQSQTTLLDHDAADVAEVRPAKRGEVQTPPAVRANDLSADAASDRVIESNFDPRLIGELLLRLTEGENGVEKVIGYAAIVAKAKRARLARQRNSARDQTDVAADESRQRKPHLS